MILGHSGLMTTGLAAAGLGMNNDIINAHQALSAATSAAARWSAAHHLLAEFGSDWVTAGTAPSQALHAVCVASTTPAGLMSEYISEKVYETDPWMSHCVATTATDECDLQAAMHMGLLADKDPLSALLLGHHVKHVVLVPAWTGVRTGGIVLYATSKETAARLSAPDRRAALRACVSAVAAWVRPEGMPSADAATYQIRPILNPREIEVLQWLSTGLQTGEIAWRMGIANVTVSKHLQSARRKLKARTREQALAIAIRDGLVHL